MNDKEDLISSEDIKSKWALLSQSQSVCLSICITSINTISGWFSSKCVSQMVGRGFTSPPGHTKDHHKNGTNCLPALHAWVRVGV